MSKPVLIEEVQAYIASFPTRAIRKRLESHFNNVCKKNASRANQLIQLDAVKNERKERGSKEHATA